MTSNSLQRETTIGTLGDLDIERLAKDGKLITENFEKKCIRQACYELRAGNIYYDLSNNAKRIVVKEGEYILIKPRQQVVVITHEKLEIPNDMLARILTKGKLFSIGLLPVNTYADPGFVGNLGIVLFNSSTHYLKIFPCEPIAKIEFTKLEYEVQRPYHGQHGYQTQIWPIPTEMILSVEEINADPRILAPDEELKLSYGSEIPRVASRIKRYERPLIIGTCVYFALNLMLFVMIKEEIAIPIAVGVAVGVVANALTALFAHGATDFLRRKR